MIKKSNIKNLSFFFGQFVFLLILFFINSSPSIGQNKNISTSSQQWVHYFNQVKLNDKWVLLTDGGFRWKDGFQENVAYVARTAIGYLIEPNIQVSSGFAHLGSYSTGNINRVEFRPFQELTVKNKFKKFELNHRYRIEERFFCPVVNGEIQSSNAFNFRYRYAFTFSIPLFKLSKEHPEKLFLLNIGDEIFINSGKDIIYNIFDQNRLIVSPTFKLSNQLSISLTWNSQFSSTTTQASYKYTNVIWAQVRHKIDFRKQPLTK